MNELADGIEVIDTNDQNVFVNSFESESKSVSDVRLETEDWADFSKISESIQHESKSDDKFLQ
jgi:hypothetical protein